MRSERGRTAGKAPAIEGARGVGARQVCFEGFRELLQQLVLVQEVHLKGWSAGIPVKSRHDQRHHPPPASSALSTASSYPTFHPIFILIEPVMGLPRGLYH